ncbi:flavinator of succinate dehydrogenase family protein [Orientia chuto str. Dubai]|uniref:FAD assembly factor SdhE n=1 Tax=Orientia chuto str. Dubai TaxID=1359168 RepID=A0A0F3MLX2_9RICK|nr:succinate dehydrogenase assembly factor 2 [Candidatus Orientia mediorientalis]KJV56651.1 flavinator of succinate dehydrogenase family protein [Orientia chuto str. Dubai]
MNKDERQIFIKKLVYRATHRGCKENDLLLSSFLNNNLKCFSDQELLDFALILECNDNDIYKWIMNTKLCPKHLNKKLINMLRNI